VLDSAKARLLLGWEPVYDLKKLIDEATTTSGRLRTSADLVRGLS
jgi:nucleoside-diphosphate-sugar epimerase